MFLLRGQRCSKYLNHTSFEGRLYVISDFREKRYSELNVTFSECTQWKDRSRGRKQGYGIRCVSKWTHGIGYR